MFLTGVFVGVAITCVAVPLIIGAVIAIKGGRTAGHIEQEYDRDLGRYSSFNDGSKD